MILTVSTVKDSVPNLRAFCERNLAGGADHLLVFLDAADPDAEAFLRAQPNVTVVVTGERYWRPFRPKRLNRRQEINATLAVTLLSGFDWADLVFHVDADESLQVDRARLDARPNHAPVVRLWPLEAVSQMHWDGEVSLFKPMLSERQIRQLVASGVIEAPAETENMNGTWLSGHVMGKVGVRPHPGVRLELHHAYPYDSAQRLPALERDWLVHRHYESHSGEEFVRKWTSHAAAGPIRLRPRRQKLLAQVSDILADDSLGEEQRQQRLADLYRAEVEDDLPLLERLGVLVAPVDHGHRPEPIPEGDREVFGRFLDLLAAAPKADFDFRNSETRSPSALLTDLRASVGEDEALATVVDRALARAATPVRGYEEKPWARLGRRLRKR